MLSQDLRIALLFTFLGLGFLSLFFSVAACTRGSIQTKTMYPTFRIATDREENLITLTLYPYCYDASVVALRGAIASNEIHILTASRTLEKMQEVAKEGKVREKKEEPIRVGCSRAI